MRLLLLGLCLLAVGCDESKPKVADEGPSVNAYCDKMVELQEATAKHNGGGFEDKASLVTFCRSMFRKAKDKEPEAFACMARCMMDAETGEDEQRCTEKKKCLAKAKNPKLFSNRVD